MTEAVKQPKKRKFSATEITILAIISILYVVGTIPPPLTIWDDPFFYLGGILAQTAIYALLYAGLRWLYRKIKGWWKP